MTLSKRVIETLIDLVEIKLSCIEIYDREDSREVAALERCRDELEAMLAHGAAANGSGAADYAKHMKGRSSAAA